MDPQTRLQSKFMAIELKDISTDLILSPVKSLKHMESLSLTSGDIFQPRLRDLDHHGPTEMDMDSHNPFERSDTSTASINEDSKEPAQSNGRSKAIVAVAKGPKSSFLRNPSLDNGELKHSGPAPFAALSGLKEKWVLFISMGLYQMSLEDYIWDLNKGELGYDKPNYINTKKIR
jgi:hypothetical protein